MEANFGGFLGAKKTQVVPLTLRIFKVLSSPVRVAGCFADPAVFLHVVIRLTTSAKATLEECTHCAESKEVELFASDNPRYQSKS